MNQFEIKKLKNGYHKFMVYILTILLYGCEVTRNWIDGKVTLETFKEYSEKLDKII